MLVGNIIHISNLFTDENHWLRPWTSDLYGWVDDQWLSMLWQISCVDDFQSKRQPSHDY